MEIQKKYRTIFLVSLTGLGQLQSAERSDQGGMHYTDCDTGNACDVHQNGSCQCQKRANDFESFARTSFPIYRSSSRPINLKDPKTVAGAVMAYGPNRENNNQLETSIELKNGLHLLLCVDEDNRKKYTKEGLDFYLGKLEREEPSLLESFSNGSIELFPSQCNVPSQSTCSCDNHHTRDGVHTEGCQHSDLDSVADQQTITQINAYELYQASVEKNERFFTREQLKRELEIVRAEAKATRDGLRQILQKIDEIQKENRRTSPRIDSPEVKTGPYQGESSGRLSPFVGSQIVGLQQSLTED